MPTANQKTENYLNEFYATRYSKKKIVDHLAYFTDKNRGEHTNEKTIRHHHDNHTIGTLIRKYDPVAFECTKSDLKLR